jgi:hypothetical protein
MAGDCHLDSHKHLDDPPLFLTQFGRGMGPRSLQQMVEKCLAEAGAQPWAKYVLVSLCWLSYP